MYTSIYTYFVQVKVTAEDLSNLFTKIKKEIAPEIIFAGAIVQYFTLCSYNLSIYALIYTPLSKRFNLPCFMKSFIQFRIVLSVIPIAFPYSIANKVVKLLGI